MLFKKNPSINNDKLIENYINLLKKGVEAEKILVIVQNSKKKKEFIEKIKKNSPFQSIGSIKIYSFYGLIYNYILENWALIENAINDNKGKIIPNLCGLEVSQFIFKNCIQEVDFTGYNSKISLLHQLLRRNSLINLNSLSDEEIKKRTDILNESFSNEAKEAIDKYKLETIKKRAFDYIRQINLFEFLYKKTKNPFDYVFLDDADEITPCILDYLKYIKNDIKEFFIAYDSFGSSRLGYLGAINVDFEKFLGEIAVDLNKDNKKYILANNIFENIKKDILIKPDNINSKTFLKRDELINSLIDDIKSLIKKGINLNQIALVVPVIDDFLKEKLNETKINFNFLSKNEKLNQNKTIGYILELLKIINDKNNTFLSPYILKGILIELLNIDFKKALSLVQQYKIDYEFNNISVFELLKDNKDFIELFKEIRFQKLSDQLYKIAEKYVEKTPDNSKNIIKINGLLKQINDFEEIFKCDYNINDLNNILLNQLENTIISENPLSDDEIDEDVIVVSSAQKIIDYSYKVKYMFLLDSSSDAWLKQDIGPLYNAWVMQKKWSKESFNVDDNIELTKDRNARIIRKLYLLADNITLYSSIYDCLGLENFSGINKYFNFNSANDIKKIKNITPRDDQKKVLDYKGGLMSVSAAAGSGKTTIMLLLTDKILNKQILKNLDIKANNIYILTFMESAARNFKERIKAKYPNLQELPNISTIHGLALRILKENNNYSRLNLDFDFEIIDEIKRGAILADITSKFNIPKDKIALYDSAISTYKNELSKDETYRCENKLFLNVFNNYQEILKSQNLIDYDDLLLYSLKLLRNYPDILEFYQNTAKVIIEDEAQDSSYIQQNLIKLIGGKYNNIIRCGDINQAITSSFTNSDVQGFRDFIKNSTLVTMDKCQRCATGILDLANNTVKISKKYNVEPFSSLIMKPVENVNIIDKEAFKINIFENEKEETNFTVKNIQKILKENKNATLAILLRSNFAIGKWDTILKNNLIETYKNSDNLNNNPIFKICLKIFEFIINPYDNKILIEIAQDLYEEGIYKYSSVQYAKNLNEPLFLKNDINEPLFWDMNYFLYKNHTSIYNMSYFIASYYFSNTVQNVNIPLFSSIVDKIFQSQKTLENTVLKLREIQYKNNFSNIKFFNIEDNKKKNSKVQIMTLHKSKGDEFDYVFIPELYQDNLCLNPNELKLKENSEFIQKIKKDKKTPEQLKKELVEENFRLIYVGITRAKKKLYLSTSKKYKYFSKIKQFKPTEILEDFIYEKN